MSSATDRRLDRRLRPGEVAADESTRAERRAHQILLLKVAAALGLVWLLGQLVAVVWPESISDFGGRTSYSYKADGYRGCMELMRALGHAAEPKRSSYGQLPAPDAGVIVMIDPLSSDELEQAHEQMADASQTQALKSWLTAGGHVIASAPARAILRVSALGTSVDLEPDEHKDLHADAVLDDVLTDGLPHTTWIEAHGELVWEAALGGASETWSFPEGRAAELAAPFLSPARTEFRFPFGDEKSAPPELQVFAEPVPSSYEVLARFDGHPFVLLQHEKQGLAWLVASSWPFSNLALARYGTANFTTQLCSLADDDEKRALYFDEYGHGLWERGGWLFWLRQDVLLYPALGLGAIALLLLWRGSQRFGALADQPVQARRAKEEFVLGLADIALRAGRHRAAARSLLATYHIRLGEHGLERDSEPGWARLDASVSSAGQFGQAELRGLARAADELYQRQLASAGLAAAGPAPLHDSGVQRPVSREHTASPG